MGERATTVSQADLVAGFRRLGLQAGLTAMAHSSLSAFGWVEGGAETVVKAFLEVLGPGGTLVMPTLCQRDRELRFSTWNRAHSPSDVGRITEVFRLWPGVIRSDHATHSVAALGPLAETITSGHAQAHGRPGPWGPAAFGHGSPWEHLHELNATYCFLGVNFRVNTMRHFVQSLLVEDILARASAERQADLRERLAGWLKPGVWPNWDDERMERRLAAMNLVRYADIGQARCAAILARLLVRRTLAIIKAERAQWLDEPFLRWWRDAESAEP